MSLKINLNFFIIVIIIYIIYIIYSLLKKKSSCNVEKFSCNVEKFSNNEWVKKNLENKIPFVIKNGAKLLKAYNKWDDNYLKKIIGKDLFWVETSYNTVFSPSDPYSKAGFTKMSFNDFSKKYINNKMNQTNKKHLNYYLAQIDIPNNLLDDVKNPFSDVVNKDPAKMYLFLGVGGNITRAHVDDANNFFFLLDGTKEFLLISPEYKHRLYLQKKKKKI